MANNIPKRIHLIWWQGFSELPQKFEENVKSIEQHNPDWQIYKWDEKSIRPGIESLGPEYIKTLDSFKLLHQKIDFSRALLLYNFGGASADTDIFAFKGFDETPHINDSDFIVSRNSRDSGINNATILVSEKNPLMKEFLDSITPECVAIQSNFSCIQSTTGPNVFTDFVNKHKDQITVLNHIYWEPCSSNDAWCEIPKESILDHRHELSWLNPMERFAGKIPYFVKQYKFPILIVVLLGMLYLIVKNK